MERNIGAEEDAQDPVRGNPQRGSLDATESAHVRGPELIHGATDHPSRLSFSLTEIANIRFTDCVNFDRICTDDW